MISTTNLTAQGPDVLARPLRSGKVIRGAIRRSIAARLKSTPYRWGYDRKTQAAARLHAYAEALGVSVDDASQRVAAQVEHMMQAAAECRPEAPWGAPTEEDSTDA